MYTYIYNVRACVYEPNSQQDHHTWDGVGLILVSSPLGCAAMAMAVSGDPF